MECQSKEAAIVDAETRAASIIADLERLVSGALREFGLSAREIKADWSKTPKTLKEAMPREPLKSLSVGLIPKHGFGLGSSTGTGKTMAMAAIVKGFQRSRLLSFAKRLPEMARERLDTRFCIAGSIVWLTWPDTVTSLRAHAVDGEAEKILERAEYARLLILDDLGRERIKGSYLEDWAASQLDRLVNHRYREELPTLWTTNLSEAALTSIYGAALVSRLTEDNPLSWVEGLPSMRIR